MTLEEVASSTQAMPISAIGADVALTLELQNRLSEFGLLDPPADGSFGPVSAWALGAFLERTTGVSAATSFGGREARAILEPPGPSPYPLKPGDDFAGRVVRAATARGDWVCRHPGCINIVYVDGTDADGTPNANMHNKFEDVRLAIRVRADGIPSVEAAWEATTEPGTFYVRTKKLHAEGAAHIVAGQYKSWSIGIHKAGSPSAHEALVQTLPIKITRDGNEDFDPIGDKTFVGMFGVNQHWGFDFSREDVRTASAGCLVGRTRNGHRQFMALCKSDPRYLVNHSYRFMTSVLPAESMR
ncbi:peptidoglycan-binding domain-containing protein [Variovorax sp. RT4R15]|uniref:peptidoglycan-binding domain-containing protein n=1 Tax=Variovorax sp. RT4R15 TaxID=3443737 RepID=UPI003F4812B9